VISYVHCNVKGADENRYDMEWGGSFYPLCNFARSVGIAALT